MNFTLIYYIYVGMVFGIIVCAVKLVNLHREIAKYFVEQNIVAKREKEVAVAAEREMKNGL